MELTDNTTPVDNTLVISAILHLKQASDDLQATYPPISTTLLELATFLAADNAVVPEDSALNALVKEIKDVETEEKLDAAC